MPVKFFGTIDCNKQGKIASQIPAYLMETHIDSMRESIDSKKRSLERGEIPLDAVGQTKGEIRKEEERLKDILESRPKVSKETEEKLWKIYKSLGKDIQDTMFTRSEMQLGLASPHEEAKRCNTPIIKVERDVLDLCKQNEIPITEKGNGVFITRNDASRAWKWIGRYLGEASNVETLRKDRITVRTARK